MFTEMQQRIIKALVAEKAKWEASESTVAIATSEAKRKSKVQQFSPREVATLENLKRLILKESA